jgi:hypothetical protein
MVWGDCFGWKKMTSLTEIQKKVTEEGEEVPAEIAPSIGNIPDLNEASKVWQWAGVDFGESTLYLLQKSL